MLTLDITSFLTQNTAFYAGFLLGLLVGAFIAYQFFKSSLRYFKEHFKNLKNELEREQKRHEFITNEFTKTLAYYLSQGKGDKKQTDNQTSD